MSYFSEIDSFVVAFTGNAEAQARTVREMKRVGFKTVRTEWNFPNPYDKVLLRNMPHSGFFDKNIGFFNCAVTHYRIIKIAYELGLERAVIVEDDCRFRKDMYGLDSLPEADLILLDSIPRKDYVHVPSELPFVSFDVMRSSACYYVSKKCMERLIWLYESAADADIKHRKARLSDQWFERKYLKGLSIVRANPNIAVQQTQPTKRNSGNRWRLEGYAKLGIDLDNYAKF